VGQVIVPAGAGARHANGEDDHGVNYKAKEEGKISAFDKSIEGGLSAVKPTLLI
jgi:hypothetical protein